METREIVLDCLVGAPGEIKRVGPDDLGWLSGYASTFGGAPDRAGDVVMPGAFAKSLRRAAETRRMPAMLWAHDQAEPIGRWETVREDGKGLLVEGRFNLATAGGRKAFEHVKAGDVSGLSIGYVVPPGGRVYDGSKALLREVDLVEVSIVAVPANDAARVTSVKSVTSPRDLEELLHKSGLSRAAAAKVVAGGWSALTHVEESEAQKLAARIAAATEALRSTK